MVGNQATIGRVVYSEDEEYPQNTDTTRRSHQLTRRSSTSSLSEADAEGEPDDLDADADGIEDDDGIEYDERNQEEDVNYEPIDGVTTLQDSGEDYEHEEYREDEEMDLDENASSPPPSPPSQNLSVDNNDSSKKSIVLKLKLATLPTTHTTNRPTAKRKTYKKPSVPKPTFNRSRSNQKVNTSNKRQQQTDEEDDELAEESLGINSDMEDDRGTGNPSGLYQDSDDSDGASTSGDTAPGLGQLTVRQRARECGEPVMELQSLPMTDGKKKKELTEADRAMEKAEKSRKRKHQNEKKLEDEKTETINRLLKGQVGKAARGSGSKNVGAGLGAQETTEENGNQHKKPSLIPPIPTLIRSVSTIKSGEFFTSLNFPTAILQNNSQINSFLNPPSNTVVYPPPVRPPPKSWKLVNGLRVTSIK